MEGSNLNPSSNSNPKHEERRVRMRGLARVASVALGVQFGWALQTSLLTPYVQELGIPHTYAGYIWLCGPISGLFVQPIAGYYSDRCQLKWGRRRPFILGGAIFVAAAIFIISFAADIGYLLGDDPSAKTRVRAIVFFVAGFWLLDLANNTLQGPCRALLADLSGKNYRRTRRANAFFSLFLSIGNVLGYAAGAYNSWFKIFPFTKTKACRDSCANLKSAFLIDVVVLVITTLLSITAAKEIPWSPDKLAKAKNETPTPATPLLLEENGNSNLTRTETEEVLIEPLKESEAFIWELLGTVRDMPRDMWCVLTITALTWFAWYPFWLFNTDWVGREVFRGEPNTATSVQYDQGVRVGSFGLMLNSIVLGLTSIALEPICRRLSAKNVWALGNLIMSGCFFTAVIISFVMRSQLSVLPGAEIASLVYFAILGAPLAVTYSIPFALIAAVATASGGGQGLSVGVLNLAVVLPQCVVSIVIGPWNALFGGGDLPAYALSAAISLVSGILAPYLLPKPQTQTELPGSKLRRTISAPIP